MDIKQTVLTVDKLGKRYALGGLESLNKSFREMLIETLFAPIRRYKKLSGKITEKELFWALKDINFTINKGEIVGIIGRNGAGKSTLLKILSRITTPTEGSVTIKGKVASLLEVGTGFHPELSGRENIYLNGAILGMSRQEIRKKFADIVEFADIEQFVDTPVKRYSSGMYVRLAFSIAAHIDPDVLIVDEVLAVGDAQFQKRCLGKIKDVAGQGRTVLFVSHNMNSVNKLCTRALLLEKGKITMDADVNTVINHYLRTEDLQTEGVWESDKKQLRQLPVDIFKISIFDSNLKPNNLIPYNEKFFVNLRYKINEEQRKFIFGLSIMDVLGHQIFVSHHYDYETVDLQVYSGEAAELQCEIPKEFFKPGDYTISIFCLEKIGNHMNDILRVRLKLKILNVEYNANPGRLGIIVPKLPWRMIS